MSITIQIERNSTATSGSVHVETDLVVLTASTSVPQEVDDAIMTFKNTGESPCQGYDAVKLLIETVLSSTGAPSAAVWFPAPEGGDGESQLHISGSVRVEGVRNGKRFTLACQGSPHTMVPNLTGCEELWVGLAGAERSVEMGRKRSSGVVGGSAFLVRPQDSLAPPQHQEPPAPAQPASPKPDPKPVAKPTPAPQPDPVQPKLNPTPAPPQPAASPTPAPAPDPVPKPETPPAGDHDSNKAQSEEDQVSLDSSTLLKVPTRGAEAYLARSRLVDGIKCPTGTSANLTLQVTTAVGGRRPAEGTRRLVRTAALRFGQSRGIQRHAGPPGPSYSAVRPRTSCLCSHREAALRYPMSPPP